MPKQRKSYNADLKARVAIAAIKGQETINKIASRYEAHPNRANLWKRRALEEMPSEFSGGFATSVKRNNFAPDFIERSGS